VRAARQPQLVDDLVLRQLAGLLDLQRKHVQANAVGERGGEGGALGKLGWHTKPRALRRDEQPTHIHTHA
jgi:hypothetical protein